MQFLTNPQAFFPVNLASYLLGRLVSDRFSACPTFLKLLDRFSTPHFLITIPIVYGIAWC